MARKRPFIFSATFVAPLALTSGLALMAGASLISPVWAQSYVPQSQVNQPNGVAALDQYGNVTDPLSTPGDMSGAGKFAQGYRKTPPILPWTGWRGAAGHLASPSITFDTPQIELNSQLPAHTASFGGHNLHDSVFMKQYALPYGVGDKGCVHSALMTNAPGGGGQCGAGGWDAVTEYELATNNVPWYVAGEDFPDENGQTHTVTFMSNGALVRPALPESYADYMHGGMHVMTNIVSGPTIYSGLDLDGVQEHRNQDQRYYGATLIAYESGNDAAGSYTRFTMDGPWQPVTGPSVDKDHVPGVGTPNTSGDLSLKDSLDKVEFGEYAHPFIEFGVYIKHFTRNTSCEVVAVPGDDGSAAKRLGPSRKCDEELDNWYVGPDYGATMHGLTIGGGFTNKVSMDSYGLSVAGAWPEGIRSWLGSDGIDFDGDEYKTGSRIGAPATVGARKVIAEWWQEPTANIGYIESLKI